MQILWQYIFYDIIASVGEDVETLALASCWCLNFHISSDGRFDNNKILKALFFKPIISFPEIHLIFTNVWNDVDENILITEKRLETTALSVLGYINYGYINYST